MRMPLISRMIFTAVGVSLPIAAHRADMNETHIYNPRWPPHAKFHDGQTLSLSLLLGGLTTFLAWKSSRNVPMMVAGAGIAASLYFISQSTAILYPGTDYSDPEFGPRMPNTIPPVFKIDGVYLAAVGLATVFGLVRCQDARQPGGKTLK
jgi:hypothetical protein